MTAEADERSSILVGMVDLEVKDLKHLIEVALKSLPEQTALIYSFSRNAGLTHAEIAEKLDVSKKTIEYHIGSALRQIKNVLQKSGYVLPAIFGIGFYM
jgi:RNA polymerase sigma-70 factor (ECF subfamily)